MAGPVTAATAADATAAAPPDAATAAAAHGSANAALLTNLSTYSQAPRSPDDNSVSIKMGADEKDDQALTDAVKAYNAKYSLKDASGNCQKDASGNMVYSEYHNKPIVHLETPARITFSFKDEADSIDFFTEFARDSKKVFTLYGQDGKTPIAHSDNAGHLYRPPKLSEGEKLKDDDARIIKSGETAFADPEKSPPTPKAP